MADQHLSVVVISYEMKRELRRTLTTLAAPCQRGIARDEYDVLVMDNGSRQPPQREEFADLDLDLQIAHFPTPTPSPVAALNAAVAGTRGALVGVMIDGARMVTPPLESRLVSR